MVEVIQLGSMLPSEVARADTGDAEPGIMFQKLRDGLPRDGLLLLRKDELVPADDPIIAHQVCHCCEAMHVVRIIWVVVLFAQLQNHWDQVSRFVALGTQARERSCRGFKH